MIYFVGAGSGAPDLITVRGMRLLQKADVIIYAGSLVNPQLLDYAKEGCEIHNSAKMTLEEVISVMEQAEKNNLITIRLHTGEPSIYGAVREQMDILDQKGIAYESCPGCFLVRPGCLVHQRSGIAESGIYPSGCVTVTDHHPDGRKDGGAGKGEY